MADNTLVLCGGTGAHVALAFLRLHFLGAALGYFRRGDGNLAVFPELFLVDQDAGDGTDAGSTAWQTVRFLVEHHPGRLERASRMGRNEAPAIRDVRPLPVGRKNEWYRPPHDNLQGRFASSPLLPLLFAEKQRRIEYSKGMMGSPALGSMLFKLKEYDERETGVNNDEVFGELLRKEGRIVVAGSGVGGTGASVTPTLARRLADKRSNSVMAAILLSWFKFDEQVADPVLRERAAIKNRVLQQNAHSALEFCGQSLARHVATVPVGMPEGALVLREFTGDFAQPICESFAHYVAALAAFRQFTSENPYGQGLFAMGALGRGRLDGSTAIPGGTLQDLVNRAATLVDLLEVWGRMLTTPQTDRIVPSLYSEVKRLQGDPLAVANALGEEAGRYREQLAAVAAALDLKPQVQAGLTLEQRCRTFLAKSGGLATGSDPGPLRLALAIFHRAADEVRGAASEQNLLAVRAGHPDSSHWPDLHQAGINIGIRHNGDLNMVPEGNIPAVIQAIVNREALSANGWPHPLAAADFFKDAIRQRDPTAWRQLEILLVGVASGLLEAREVEIPAAEEAVSLEGVVREYERREGFEGVGQLGIYSRSERGEERLIAFSSPFTVLAPVPFLDDAADNALWQGLWENLSGAADGGSWRTAPGPQRWGEERAVWRVRAWLARERSIRGDDGPTWSQLFKEAPAHPPVTFGAGKGLRVYWRGENLIDLNLPDHRDPPWVPGPGVPEREVADLRRHVPELAAIDGFSEVEFEMPNVAGKVSGWWREHLDELRQSGRIFAFGQMPNRQVAIGTLVAGTVHKTIFPSALILGRAEIAVQKVTPLEQKPIFGAEAGPRRFPDLPLKAEFFGLATSADRPLLEVAQSGGSFQDYRTRPVETPDGQGRPVVTWRVGLLGRRDPLPIAISLADEPDSSAHWMVWPRFRSADPSLWRAYYLYDHCRNPNLVCDVLWLEGTAGGSSRLQLKERQAPFQKMEPIRYNTQQDSRSHTGGPPLALALRNHRNGDQRGLYLVPLEVLQSAEIDLKLAVDFGTSHSVVAMERGADRLKRVVALSAELDPAARSRALSLHLSEDREHLSEKGGLEEDGNWMPNYRRSSAEMMPSELLLYRPLDQAKGDDLGAWLPLQHYTIPPLSLARSDVGKQIVSGFKWDASSTHFQGREPQLREHYQSLLLELALADLVANELRNIPSGNVGVTFCYPLRSPRDQIQGLRSTIDVVLRRTARSTGIRTSAYRDIGILDESRAAAERRELAGEVCMVADLGGGTLDVFISGYDGQRRQLDEVADSVRLGGNLLLREMIQAAASYMPKNGNWEEFPEAKLNAWIRGKGAASLWGPDAGARPKFPELDVTGFEKPAEANLARQLINRYFSLIVDFLARNLAAYLTGVWYPGVQPADYGRLSVAVQLRGNGWRLRYQPETESGRNRAIQELVRERLTALWKELPELAREFPLPVAWLESSGFSSRGAKTAPALGAVGEAMSQDEVRSSWHTCTLVEVEVLRDSGVQPVPWTARVPFDTGGLTGVQLTQVSPAVPIDPAGVEKPVVLSGLDAALLGHINRALQNDGRLDGHRYSAPVSAEVWETLFRVPQFWPHKQGGR